MSKCCKKDGKDPDAEFESYMRKARALMITLRRPEDRECCEEILSHISRLHKSGKKEIKVHNNKFFAYFIRVLHANAATQPLEIYEQWYRSGTALDQAATTTTARVWLQESKSYFAMEKMIDGSIIFYSAVVYNPEAGWDKGGIRKTLEGQQDNPVGF